jgi:uncharacterized Zn finger protein
MIETYSKAIQKASMDVKIGGILIRNVMFIKNLHTHIIADVNGSKKNTVYRVILCRDQNKHFVYGSCNCQGALFNGKCKHIYAVNSKLQEKRV